MTYLLYILTYLDRYHTRYVMMSCLLKDMYMSISSYICEDIPLQHNICKITVEGDKIC